MNKILVVNGPNLAALGLRQPEIYGSEGLSALPGVIESIIAPRHVDLDFFQSNHEGAIIDRLEQARLEGVQGVAINAGALTHTSLALADSLAWLADMGMRFVEVHLSNIWARTDQPLRHQSLMGKNCLGVVAGFGLASYGMAVLALLEHKKQ